MQYQFDSTTVIVLAFFTMHCGGDVREVSDVVGSGGTSFGGTPISQTPTLPGTARDTMPSTLPTSGGASSVASTALFGSGGSTISNSATGGVPITPAPACTPELNLLEGDLGPNGNWIGGEASSRIDNPCDIQGLIYAFGDMGLDNVPGTADDTCPFLNQEVSPCINGRCCVSGETRLWPPDPNNPSDDDYGASVWGCGIGISFNDPKEGVGTLPYDGPAKKFKLALGGSSTGQAVRIGYTQVATDSKIPFTEIYPAGTQTVTVGFQDVLCPDDIYSNYEYEGCLKPGDHPHSLQVWVAGGDTVGSFELCIDGVYPVL